MKTRNPELPTFTFYAAHDFQDTEIELEVEILSYIGEHQGGCWDERLAPCIEIGDAWTMDGEYFELTPLQREAAAEKALREIQDRPSVICKNGEYIGEL